MAHVHDHPGGVGEGEDTEGPLGAGGDEPVARAVTAAGGPDQQGEDEQRWWFVAWVEADGRSALAEGADMATYLIYFNQQWVGDHPEEWFRSRGPLARAVVEEIRAAGDYVFAGGLEDEGPVFSADATSGALSFTDGPFVETKEWLGGLTIVDVADEEAARVWAGKIAEACGWPQETRLFKG